MTPQAILSFDTSGAHCAVAVVVNGALRADAVEQMTTGQSERLFPMIEAVLAAASLGVTDISRIAVGTGPGNFTGTRIGVAAARGLALSLDVPAVGVSRLTALGRGDGAVTAAVAAHRGQAYRQDFIGGMPQGDPQLVAADSLGAVRADASLDRADAIPLAEVLAIMARIAAEAPPDAPPPAPVYLRGPDAALPADPPPMILS